MSVGVEGVGSIWDLAEWPSPSIARYVSHVRWVNSETHRRRKLAPFRRGEALAIALERERSGQDDTGR